MIEIILDLKEYSKLVSVQLKAFENLLKYGY